MMTRSDLIHQTPQSEPFLRKSLPIPPVWQEGSGVLDSGDTEFSEVKAKDADVHLCGLGKTWPPTG